VAILRLSAERGLRAAAACLATAAALVAAPGLAMADQVILDDPQTSGPSQNVTPFTGVGWDGDLLRTYAEGEGQAEVNGAAWTANLAGGSYNVEAFVPSQHAVTTVKYTVAHGGGQTTVAVQQNDYNDVWVSLGTYGFGAGQAAVRSTDAGGVRGHEMAWDAVRWTQTGAPSGSVRYRVANATIPVNLRAGPGTGFGVVGTAAPGQELDIGCQTAGTNVSGSTIWDRLTSGSFISDFYTSTPVFADFSPGLNRCAAVGAPPGQASFRYRIANATISVTLRSGPGTNTSSVGSAAPNSSVDIACQTVGGDVNGSRIWDRLTSGAFVSDYWVSTPIYGSYSPNIPHCDGAPDTVAPQAPGSGGGTPWRITAPAGVALRHAPSLSAPKAGRLPFNGAVMIECQTVGDNVNGSRIWDQVGGGGFVSDYYVNTPVFGGYTAGIRRCDGAGEVEGPTSPPSGGATWGMVSLGDSFSSGEGAPDLPPALSHPAGAFWENQACHRSHIAWPAQVASRLGLVLRNFSACSGATTDALVDPFKGQRAQVAELASAANARLVTLTFGGNDVDFRGIAIQCLAPALRSCDSKYGRSVRAVIDDAAPALRAVYRRVLRTAPDARIAVVGYPQFFTGPQRFCPFLSDAERAWMNSQIEYMNKTIARMVRDIGSVRLTYLDVTAAFANRGVCSADSLMNGPTQPVMYSLHPNRNGQGALTDVITARLR
jgi:uncharacterized protein YraI/lysophospholipase L1-like esterase